LADLNDLNASTTIKIAGANNTGLETNFANVDASGNMYTSQPGVLSTLNSTTSNLGANGVFTGTAEEILDYAMIGIQIYTDQASATLGFRPQYSTDATNWDDGDAYTMSAQTAGNGKFFTFPPQARYYRIVYTNGAVAQTMFRLQTIFHRNPVKTSSHRIDDILDTENDAELTKSIITGKRLDGSFDTIRQTNNNELLIADTLNSGGTQGALTVGTTAVLVNVSGTNLTNRKSVSLYNNSLLTFFWGYTNTVTSTTGTPIAPGQFVTWDVGATVNIYVITTLAAQNARITEAS